MSSASRHQGSDNYSLTGCQVTTPLHVVRGVWRTIADYRPAFDSVVDLGAGDGRFALGGAYASYTAVEIDGRCKRLPDLPRTVRFRTECAFEYRGGGFDLCIGNPPYVRHHHVDKDWLRRVRKEVEEAVGASISLQANLFVYFMFLGILKTKPDGLVAMVVPFEWTTRPSVRGLRSLVSQKGWNVDIFRLGDEVFEGVLTTACVAIIDKSASDGRWRFFDVDDQWNVEIRKGPTGTGAPPFQHEKRGTIWAMRGLSPGTQQVFTLSEGQRIHNGLSMRDVMPCLTSLRHLPSDSRILDWPAFRQYYVSAGKKCWLVRSCDEPSSRLRAYLESVPNELRDTKTCSSREPWYAFKRHPIPSIVYSAGFVAFGPKAVTNAIGATPVGSVQGIHSDKRINTSSLREHLCKVNFERKVVAHAKTLKKVEVKQMNAVLNRYCQRKRKT